MMKPTIKTVVFSIVKKMLRLNHKETAHKTNVYGKKMVKIQPLPELGEGYRNLIWREIKVLVAIAAAKSLTTSGIIMMRHSQFMIDGRRVNPIGNGASGADYEGIRRSGSTQFSTFDGNSRSHRHGNHGIIPSVISRNGCRQMGRGRHRLGKEKA